MALYVMGYIIIIVSALLLILRESGVLAYVFLAGVLLAIAGTVMTLPVSDNFRVRRLNHLMGVSAVLLLVSVYFVFRDNNAWVVTLLLAAFINLFTSFRYPGADGKK